VPYPSGLIGTTATSQSLVGAAPDRRQAYVLGFRSAMGCGITGLRRSNIAHHRRSWPASLAEAAHSLRKLFGNNPNNSSDFSHALRTPNR
jgi:hypothetical protein